MQAEAALTSAVKFSVGAAFLLLMVLIGPAAARVTFWGALAMTLTWGIGALVGRVV